jgi:hypothetical protein
MDPDLKKMFREYAWEYFKLHAGQRLQSFNFFLIVAGLLAAAITSLLKDGGAPRGLATPLGLALVTLSFVFWRLEERTKHLVKNAEAALKHLDSQEGLSDDGGTPNPLRLFDRDDYLVGMRWLHLSYSNCFGIVFLVFGILGMVLAVAALIVPFSRSP